VGGRERDKVTEALVQALRHKLCLIGWPHSTPVRHWEAEVRIHLATARRRFRNSMRQYMTPESWQEDYQSALLETASHMADEWRRRWLCRTSAPGRWRSCSPRERQRSAGSPPRPGHERPAALAHHPSKRLDRNLARHRGRCAPHRHNGGVRLTMPTLAPYPPHRACWTIEQALGHHFWPDE